MPLSGVDDPTCAPQANSRRRRALALVASVVALAAACTLPDATREARSLAARSSAPELPLRPTVDASNGFGAETLAMLATTRTDENLAIDPPALQLSLGLLASGTGGTTRTQILASLHATDPDLASSHNLLDHYVRSRAGSVRNDYRRGSVEVPSTIAVWAQVGTPLESAFLDQLATNYGAGVDLVDFRSDPESAREQMRTWAQNQPVPDDELLDATGIDEMTKLVSLSSGTLSAPWATPLNVAPPGSGRFADLDGRPVAVDMLSGTVAGLVGEQDAWKAIELPYLGGQLGLLLVQPQDFDGFAVALDGSTFSSVAQQLRPEVVDIRLPAFSVSSSLRLDDELRRLGIKDAWDPEQADFSAMTADSGMHLSRAVHGASLSVGASGSGADAASVQGPEPPEVVPVAMAIDGPFFFAVRDKPTGLILLQGWVQSPGL